MNKRNAKLVGLMIFGLLIFNFPIVAIFKKPTWVMGIPSTLIYLFGAWLLFVFAIRQIVEPIKWGKK